VLPIATVRDLLRLYLSDCDQCMSGIAMAERDLSAIGRQAHILVAAAGNIGAMRVSAIARDLEHACREGRGERSGQLVASLMADRQRNGRRDRDLACRVRRGQRAARRKRLSTHGVNANSTIASPSSTMSA
jgi:HPt (histidine-containing phosphotransfer) domain-containing protein